MKTTLALLLLLLPSLVRAQVCPGNDSKFSRDGLGVTSVSASACYDVSVRAHFLGSRGAFRTALAFDNPQFPLANSCPVSKSCLKYTHDCTQARNIHGGFQVPACVGDRLSDPTEISCHCQAPDWWDFKTRIPVNQSQNLSPEFLIDRNGDDVVDTTLSDELKKGGMNYRIYQLFRTLSRWELEDLHAGPAGDFNDYLAALELKDCSSKTTVVFPPHTVDMGVEGRKIDCVDRCQNGGCDPSITDPHQPLRFTVALGIDDSTSEADRERRGRKLHLTVATHTDVPSEGLAVCPVLWLDWKRTRDPAEVKDRTQMVNYGAESDCVANQNMPPVGVHLCPPQDKVLFTEAMPISFSAGGSSQQCHQNLVIDETIWSYKNSSAVDECGARTIMRDYELPLSDIDNGLADSSLWYGGTSSGDLSKAVVRVELMVFRGLSTRLQQLPASLGVSPTFVCPSGINALLRGAPSSVAEVTRYTFNPPTRPNPTPGFTVYVRQ